MKRLLPLSLVFALFVTACGIAPTPAQQASTNPAPSQVDNSGFSDSAPLVQDSKNGPVRLFAPHIGPSENVWHPHLTIAKCYGEFAVCTEGDAYEVDDTEGNNVTTAGANQLWTGLSTTVALPWNTTNTQFAVGDSSSAFAAGQTDLQAALATKMNAADMTSCTNATPIVCGGTFSPVPTVGQVYAFSGFAGAGGASINNTFELSAASASSITLLNSAGGGSITLTGGVAQLVNKYRQIANGAGSAVVSTNQIVYVATVGTTNGNMVWNEWGMTTGAAATNKQAAPPPTLLNRAVVNLGTKTSASSFTATLTLSLS
jgi:hypothetical protein